MDNARTQTSRLLDLLRREQGAMADFLVALAEFHRERREVRGEGAGAEPDEGGGPATPPESRHIPAAVQREVWNRDEGRCAWPTADGGVCGSTWRLQFDHILAVAKGGQSTVSNIRLACAFHNDLSARIDFGDDWMDRYTRGAGASSVAPPPSRPAAPV